MKLDELQGKVGLLVQFNTKNDQSARMSNLVVQKNTGWTTGRQIKANWSKKIN
ncbi:MAG: hypothetical protein WBA84_11235 [Carnobacterium sp.]|uniref:hypothetical protein n=1 Tax=Carnobacterium sp. TaxID=48221 RepID=UPI003C70B97E